MMASCTEDYLLPHIGDHTTIVITGLVTNEQGPYYVKVMENVSDISTGKNIQRGINDALVTITDGNGNVDELRSFYSVPLDSVLTSSGIYDNGIPYEIYQYFIEIPDGDKQGAKFTIMKDAYGIWNDVREGAYFTKSTKGVPGNTYTLKVYYAGHEYTATDKMCYGTVIDSVSLEPIGRYIYDKPDGSDGFLVPCLYFAEPQDEVNFYMFKETSITRFYNYAFGLFEVNYEPVKYLVLGILSKYSEDWIPSVVSDRFMPPYVYQYKMSDGDQARKYFSGTDIGFYGEWNNGGSVDMLCISEPVYRYYAALSKQFYDDGGVYSPSPASPPTNISGGAQGCFSAASVSQYFLDLSNHENQ